MKKIALVVWLLPCAAWGAEPVVWDVRGWQDGAAGKVQVLYNLADADTAKLQVTLEVSADGGATWDVPVQTLDKTAGIGDEVTPGMGKLIVWDAKADWPGMVSSRVRFRVNATDTPVAPAPSGMALIPAGSFSMGNQMDPNEGWSDELPVHSVYVSAFYMDRYEVTKALWDEVRGWGSTRGYTDLRVGGGKGANHPVHTVSWWDVVKWSNARSEKEGLTPVYRNADGTVFKTGTSVPDVNWSANGYRLPTEAEWEKAARGGLSGKRFPWGDTISHSQANYYSDSGYSYDVSSTRGFHPDYDEGDYPYTSPVGSFAPNGYLLYDMAGNVWEWCWDWHSSGYYSSSPGSDPRGPTSGSVRVIRGGFWGYGASFCRSASRRYDSPGYGYFYLGFRCARSSVP
jgi:formylglycine-generating enzyme